MVSQRCAVCGSATRLAHRSLVLGKYDVAYFHCDRCGLLQTERPFWLDEAYGSVIARSDTGLVTRNIALSVRLASVLNAFFDPRARYADVGGGYGVLTRLMRDIGFDYYWSDPYCANLFAQGFEAEPPAASGFEAVSAFEVMEHVHDPLAAVRSWLAEYGTRTLVFSTQLYHGAPPAPGAWAYYSPATGQHVSFYQRRTLDRMASELGLRAYSAGYLHLLTDRTINPALYRAAASRLAFPLLPLVRLRLRSRTTSDSDEMLRRAGRSDDRGARAQAAAGAAAEPAEAQTRSAAAETP